MAYTNVPTENVGDILTAAYLNTYLRDNLAYLKGQAGDIYIEDDLGVGTSSPLANITASTYGRGVTVSTANSNETNALIAEGHRSGSDAGFGHLVGVNRAATGTDKRGGIVAFLRDTDDNSAQVAIATRNAGAVANRMWIKRDGKVGINQSTPQGLLHGYNAISGFLHWEFNGVDGTARTVIPDGAGDVAIVLMGMYAVQATGITDTGTLAAGGGTGLTPGGGGFNLHSDGTNTLKLTVAADGSVTVQRTLGSLSFKVALWLLWL